LCTDDSTERGNVQQSGTDDEPEELHVVSYSSSTAEAQQNTARQSGNAHIK